jgi:iron-sulfur cluster assembly protein
MMGFGLTTNEIKVTDAAREYLTGLVVTHGGGAAGLRLAILAGKGCGGAEYDLNITQNPPSTHETLKVSENLTIYIPAADVLKLFGTTIDYHTDALGNTHLSITNPNEKGRCGCGESVVF